MTDMHTAALMADHFDKIQKLPNPIEGVPNFRCVPGYQVTSSSYYPGVSFDFREFRIPSLLAFMTE